MQIDKDLYNEINEFCKLNNLKTRDFIHKLLKDAYLKEKYGESPFFIKTKEIKQETSINSPLNVITYEKNTSNVVREIVNDIESDENILNILNINDTKNEIESSVIQQNEETTVTTQKVRRKRKLK
jgi:hypothetical protein